MRLSTEEAFETFPTHVPHDAFGIIGPAVMPPPNTHPTFA